MNPKQQRSLFESVNSIVFPKQEDAKEQVNENFDVEEFITLFLNETLGNDLQEGTDEQIQVKILEAVRGLNVLTDLVNDYFGFSELSE